MTNQPKWKFVANLGDVNPIEHGGYFVKVDTTGVYDPEVEVLIPPDEDSDGTIWEVYRFVVEFCTYQNGILSDNKFHPDSPAWFAKPESERKERPQDTTYMNDICSCLDVKVEQLVYWFCSSDPVERAWAWRCVGEYHGWHELDHDGPLKLNRREIFGRYNSRINMLNRQRVA